jgi:hypothetical protein
MMPNDLSPVVTECGEIARVKVEKQAEAGRLQENQA